MGSTSSIDKTTQDVRDCEIEKANLSGGFFNIINGKRQAPGATLNVVNPATGKVLATVPDASRGDLDEAVASARTAFPKWSATPYPERKAMVEKFLARITEHEQDLFPLLTLENGRPLSGSIWEIQLLTEHFLKKMLDLELVPEESESKELGHVTKRYIPLGVVCAISPWNVPVLLSYMKAMAAILTGNTVVLKPSPFTPLTVLRIADNGRDIFPPGVFNVITGGDDLGPWMTSHPGFDKVTFTGSSQTGKRVMDSAAASLKRVTLELGGNDPAILLPDADPQQIAEALFWSMFMLNGHACICIKRLYVPEQLYAQVAEALSAYAACIKTGDGLDEGSALGPVQNKLQFERIKAVWEDVKESGVKVLYQGEAPKEGFFFPVTLLDNPSDDATFVRNEVFGPIRSIFKYTNLDDAIRRANDTNYGLGASVWGKDPDKLHMAAKQLNAGTVWINQHANLTTDVPFNGHKESGFGVEFGLEGMKSYCNLQVIAAKRSENA